MNEQTVITVCLPGEQFSSRYMANWTSLLAYLLIQKGFGVIPLFGYCTDPATARNELSLSILESPIKSKYLLWIDDDNIVDPEQFEKLLVSLETIPQAAAVAGWCWCETDQYEYGAMLSCGRIGKGRGIEPFDPAEVIGRREPIDLSSFEYGGYTGFPAILMRGDTIAKLARSNEAPFAPIHHPAFRFGYSGEDYAFCVRAHAAGLKIFVDPMCQVPHLKTRPISPRHLLQFQKPKECAA